MGLAVQAALLSLYLILLQTIDIAATNNELEWKKATATYVKETDEPIIVGNLLALALRNNKESHAFLQFICLYGQVLK